MRRRGAWSHSPHALFVGAARGHVLLQWQRQPWGAGATWSAFYRYTRVLREGMVRSPNMSPLKSPSKLPQLVKSPVKSTALSSPSQDVPSEYSAACQSPSTSTTGKTFRPGTLVSEENLMAFVKSEAIVRTTDSYRQALAKGGAECPAKNCVGVVVTVVPETTYGGYTVQVMWNNGRPMNGYRVGVKNKYFDLEAADSNDLHDCDVTDSNPVAEIGSSPAKKKGLLHRMMSPFKSKKPKDSPDSSPSKLIVSVGYLKGQMPTVRRPSDFSDMSLWNEQGPVKYDEAHRNCPASPTRCGRALDTDIKEDKPRVPSFPSATASVMSANPTPDQSNAPSPRAFVPPIPPEIDTRV